MTNSCPRLIQILKLNSVSIVEDLIYIHTDVLFALNMQKLLNRMTSTGSLEVFHSECLNESSPHSAALVAAAGVGVFFQQDFIVQ